MNQKKELLRSIMVLEERINRAKTQKEKDKQYFANLIEKHRYAVVSMLLPAFLFGWQSGKHSRGKRFLGLFRTNTLFGLFKLFRTYNKLL